MPTENRTIDFSLIVASLGRSLEIKPLLDSLSQQSYLPLELIIVDQNLDNRLEPVLISYRNRIQIIHLQSEPGISKARNAGIKQARGNVVGFPDDDCCYSSNVLAKVAGLFFDHPDIDGFTGQVIDEKGNNLARFARRGGYLTKYNTWERTSSVNMFIKTAVIQEIGGFDENMGLGARSPGREVKISSCPFVRSSGDIVYIMSQKLQPFTLLM